MASAETTPSIWLPAGLLSVRLGRNERWVYREIKALCITPEPHDINGCTISCYPPGTLERLRLRSEQAEVRHRNSKKEALTVQELADRLGRSYGWTKKTLDLLQIKPLRYEQRRAFKTAIYGPNSLERLRDQLAPDSDDWYNLNQLVDHTMLYRELIERSLKEAGVVPERRQSALTGRPSYFYPPSALQVLKRCAPSVAAGDWLTATALAVLTGKSLNWTSRQLTQPDLLSLREERLDDQRVPRWHYPPRVLSVLRSELDQSERYPESGKYLPLSVVAAMVGRHPETVMRHLEQLSIVAEQRRDKKGRVANHYPPELVDQLRRHFESRSEAGTWLTLAQIATQLQVPREVIIDRLDGIGTRPEHREMAATKRVEVHYSPQAVRKLRRSLLDDPYDELIAAAPALRKFEELCDRYGLNHSQMSRLIGITTSINRVMRQQRIRRSLAESILSIQEIPPDMLACLRLSRQEWLLENVRQQASELGHTPCYSDLYACWRTGDGFEPIELLDYWETMNQAIELAICSGRASKTNP